MMPMPGTEAATGRLIRTEPLTAAAFAPFGEVLTADGPHRLINEGWCARHDDLARLDFGPEGRAGISIFRARARSLPHVFALVERHPDGSQAFIPMSADPFLVIVTEDPRTHPPRAFVTAPFQGINLHRGTWHGVLTPLAEPGIFAVIDRIGATPNLEHHRYDQPWTVIA